ncbi:MAG: peptide ABC transporter substrate-binding protein, partial [Anaerolineae bacterium]|nr:peptide ABC transporter substrate-binding protein [Anaerolineae bacterium]
DVSDDGLVYTFTIKEEAQFQNGKPIRAEDFKWSFERACDPATESRTADTYLGDIVGCRDKLQGRADSVEGIEVIDDLTLQLTIDEPKGFFLAKMTYPTAYVLDQETVEAGGDTWFESPNGSGPFVLAEYAPDEGAIILTRNDNYYGEPKPILERVIFLINAPVNIMTGYEEGLGSIGLDGFTYDTIPVGTGNLSVATDPNNPLSQEFVSTEELSVFYIGFNVNKPPFDDSKIRQAFNLALDKERMVRLVFQGILPVANGIVPPTMPGYENPDLSDFEFDPDHALELIAESSYGDVTELPEITLNVSGTGGDVSPITEAIVESLAANLGIEVAVEQADWPEFLKDLDTHPNMPYQMYQLGWVADYPDPQNFLEILFHSQSAQNHGEYANPEVDALLDQARGIQDVEERLAIYRQVEQLILEDAAWIPLYYSVETALVKPYVQNFQNPPIKVPRFQYMSIAEHE